MASSVIKQSVQVAKMILPENTIELSFEPSSEKTNNLGFRPGMTQIGLCSQRRRLEV